MPNNSIYWELLQRKFEQINKDKERLNDVDTQKYKDTFAENLQYQMKKKGTTAMDISKVMGVAYSTANDWVNGKKYPRPDKIKKLAEYFNISTVALTGELYENSDDDDIMQLRDALRVRPELKVLFDLSQKADARDIEAAIQMLTALTKDKE